jgi:hypothetical protein
MKTVRSMLGWWCLLLGALAAVLAHVSRGADKILYLGVWAPPSRASHECSPTVHQGASSKSGGGRQSVWPSDAATASYKRSPFQVAAGLGIDSTVRIRRAAARISAITAGVARGRAAGAEPVHVLWLFAARLDLTPLSRVRKLVCAGRNRVVHEDAACRTAVVGEVTARHHGPQD